MRRGTWLWQAAAVAVVLLACGGTVEAGDLDGYMKTVMPMVGGPVQGLGKVYHVQDGIKHAVESCFCGGNNLCDKARPISLSVASRMPTGPAQQGCKLTQKTSGAALMKAKVLNLGGAFSWDTASARCASEGMVVCHSQQMCDAQLKKRSVLASSTGNSGTLWFPASDKRNTWVYAGTKEQDICKTHQQIKGAPPAWGSSSQAHTGKGPLVACCPSGEIGGFSMIHTGRSGDGTQWQVSLDANPTGVSLGIMPVQACAAACVARKSCKGFVYGQNGSCVALTKLVPVSSGSADNISWKRDKHAKTLMDINLALDKEVATSGTQPKAPATLGNDGELSVAPSKCAVMTSKAKGHPWWRVDLKESLAVSQVRVWVPKGTKTSALKITVGSSTDTQSNAACGSSVSVTSGSSQVFNCARALEGRYITVKAADSSNQLGLCEVEAYGPGTPLDGDPHMNLSSESVKSRMEVERNEDKDKMSSVLATLAEDIKDKRVALKLQAANSLEKERQAYAQEQQNMKIEVAKMRERRAVADQAIITGNAISNAIKIFRGEKEAIEARALSAKLNGAEEQHRKNKAAIYKWWQAKDVARRQEMQAYKDAERKLGVLLRAAEKQKEVDERRAHERMVRAVEEANSVAKKAVVAAEAKKEKTVQAASNEAVSIKSNLPAVPPMPVAPQKDRRLGASTGTEAASPAKLAAQKKFEDQYKKWVDVKTKNERITMDTTQAEAMAHKQADSDFKVECSKIEKEKLAARGAAQQRYKAELSRFAQQLVAKKKAAIVAEHNAKQLATKNKQALYKRGRLELEDRQEAIRDEVLKRFVGADHSTVTKLAKAKAERRASEQTAMAKAAREKEAARDTRKKATTLIIQEAAERRTQAVRHKTAAIKNVAALAFQAAP